ncbi:neuropeptide FF receptor 2 [Dromiciops gliroides]|uniref:neuropeptide FF receptor 2 n=1 Tax=Dromiciops gliroides TaxID=33562 RepID=UPI001CC58D71|nr:neuropeptide FF receptor 2 [Dromiciops gliroides]
MNKELDSNFSEASPQTWKVNDTKEEQYMDINITYVDYYLHQPHVAAVFIISYFLIFVLCIVGNTVVCFIVAWNKHMHTVTNFFILNLAISDLLIGIFCMPTTLLDNIIAGWPFGSTVCKISGMVQGISVASSVFTLVAIAGDRFRCIVYPFKQKLTMQAALGIIVIIWTLAITIISPSAAMLHVQEEKHYRVRLSSPNETSSLYWCREDWPSQEMKKIYTTVLFANIYLVPLFILLLMYGRIGISLSTTARPLRVKKTQEKSHMVSKKKQRVIKMLLIVALLFMLSWLPLWTLMMLSDYSNLSAYQLQVINIYVYPFAHWLAFCNSSINPIIYGFFNKKFRSGFQDALQFQICQRRVKKAYPQRAKDKVVITKSTQPAQNPSFQNPQGEEAALWRISNPQPQTKQELTMEDLEDASNNKGITKELT